MMKRFLSAVSVCISIFPFSVFSAELTASVDNSKVAYGETIDFRLSYDGNDGGNLQPDLSVLQKDFNIYSTSSSMNTNVINGVATQKREWLVTLLPKNEGKQVIPSVSAGNYQSSPIEIEVVSADAVIKEQRKSSVDNDNTAQMASFKAELKTENKNPYVEQEIPVVLTISNNRNLQLSSEPYFENSEDWTIKRVGDLKTTQKNGEIITKIDYVFFPQKSGKQELPRAVVEGFYVVYDNSPKRTIGDSLWQLLDVDMGAMFGVQKPVLFKSKPEIIDVKPIPEEYTSHNWVPAEMLAADARWVDKNPTFKVGETVAREVTITALGVSENHLPELEFEENSAWKQYPDKPQYSSTIHDNKIISQEIIRVVYIPQKSGKIRLPEIVIPWFNTKTGKVENAVIAAEDVEVKPNKQYEALQKEPLDEQILPAKEVNTVKPETENIKQASKVDDNMMYAIIAAFFSGLLVSFLLFGRKKEAKPVQKTENYRKNVRNYLAHGDYHGTRDCLIKWGQSAFPCLKINNLKDLSDAVANEEFSKQCEIINAVLYGNSSAKPDADILIKGMVKLAKNKSSKEENLLPDLYK